jgi:hypothetical protein
MRIEVDLLQDGLVHVQREKPESQSPFPKLDDVLREAPAKPQGVCPVCKERAATRHCIQCGRDVCAQDHWTMLGLCKGCVTGKDMEAAREAGPTKRPDLDIKWIED